MYNTYDPNERPDIEDQIDPNSDYVLPEDLQDLAADVAVLETSLAEIRHAIWDDDGLTF